MSHRPFELGSFDANQSSRRGSTFDCRLGSARLGVCLSFFLACLLALLALLLDLQLSGRELREVHCAVRQFIPAQMFSRLPSIQAPFCCLVYADFVSNEEGFAKLAPHLSKVKHLVINVEGPSTKTVQIASSIPGLEYLYVGLESRGDSEFKTDHLLHLADTHRGLRIISICEMGMMHCVKLLRCFRS